MLISPMPSVEPLGATMPATMARERSLSPALELLIGVTLDLSAMTASSVGDQRARLEFLNGQIDQVIGALLDAHLAHLAESGCQARGDQVREDSPGAAIH